MTTNNHYQPSGRWTVADHIAKPSQSHSPREKRAVPYVRRDTSDGTKQAA